LFEPQLPFNNKNYVFIVKKVINLNGGDDYMVELQKKIKKEEIKIEITPEDQIEKEMEQIKYQISNVLQKNVLQKIDDAHSELDKIKKARARD
jgi:hypothetical protein